MKKIYITAGGTGGHTFPALVVTNFLKQYYNVEIITDQRGAKFFPLKTQALSLGNYPKTFIQKCVFGLRIVWSFFIILKKFYKEKPDLVIGFGGYPSFPTLAAAIRTRTPFILHEQNAYMGLANRMFSEHAAHIALSFPDTQGIPKKASPNRSVVGIPCRHIPVRPLTAPFTCVVLGGSQGAHSFAKIIPHAFARIDSSHTWHIIQQCRTEDIPEVEDFYKTHGIQCTLSPFFEDIPSLLSSAHLIISRAGASSLAEIAAAGKAAILIPYPYAKNNHQWHNARFYEKKEAAILIEHKDFTIDKLSSVLAGMSASTLDRMGKNAFSLAKLDAASHIGELVQMVTHEH